MSVSRGFQRALRGKKGSKRRHPKWHWKRRLYELIALEPRLLLSISPFISGAIEVDNGAAYTLTLDATGTDRELINHWEINWGHGAMQSVNMAHGTVTHAFPNLGLGPPPETEHDYTITAKAVMNSGASYPNLPLGLDGSFDVDGKVTEHPTTGTDQGYAMAVQPDGKIVVAGVYNGADFGLIRFHSNGKKDTTFGTNGVVSTDISGSWDKAYAVAIQPDDGKIVVAGSAYVNGALRFALARYLPDGTLDESFNGTGKVTTTGFITGEVESTAYAVALRSNGDIVAAGYAHASGTDIQKRAHFAVARYHSDGTLDTSFDNDGLVDLPFRGNTSMGLGYPSAYARALAIDSSDRIIVGGGLGPPSPGTPVIDPCNEYDFVLARLNSDGSRDTTFGDPNYNVRTEFDSPTSFCCTSTYGSVYSLVLKDDKIIAAGNSEVFGNNDFALARYNSDGTLDTTFGTSYLPGLVHTDFSFASDSAYAMTMTSAGDLILVGSAASGVGSGTSTDIAIAKYHQNGSLDTLFGFGGKMTTNVEQTPTFDVGRGVALVSDRNRDNPDAPALDRRIVIAGYSGSKFALARYQLGNRVAVTPAAPPLMPLDIDATTFSTSRIDLNWDVQPVSGETYDVYRDTFEDFDPDPSNLIASGLTDTTFADSTVASPETYFYEVVAVGFGGNASSLQQTGKTLTFNVAPQQLMAKAWGPYAIEISWEDNNSNETGYTLERLENGSVESSVSLERNAISFVDYPLAPDTSYTYRVTANFTGFNISTETTESTYPLGYLHSLLVGVNGHAHNALTPPRSYDNSPYFDTTPNNKLFHKGAGVKALLWDLQANQDYEIAVGYEWTGGPNNSNNVDDSGRGWLHDYVLWRLRQGDISDVAVFGYSHGGTVAKKLVNLLRVDYSNFGGPWAIQYSAYIDAYNNGFPYAEGHRPVFTTCDCNATDTDYDLSENFHDNFYELNTLAVHGGYIDPTPSFNTRNFERPDKKHGDIDDEDFVQNTMKEKITELVHF